MSRASTAEANQALGTTNWAYVSLHTADPGTTGTNEVAGGSYARAAVTWSAPSGGSVSNSGAIAITVPASTSVTYFGLWSASSAGTYYIGGALSPSVTTGGTAGTVTIAAGQLSVTAS